MPRKRAVNLTVDAKLLTDARKSGTNLSQTLEEALRAKLRDECHRKWLEENRLAIEESNAELERNGPWHRPDWLPE